MADELLELVAERIERDAAAYPLTSKPNGVDPAPPATPSGSAFRFELYSELDEKDEVPDWTVHGLLEADSLALIFGAPASAKSFAAVDIACCIDTGRAWHGHAVKRGPVLYIAGEGRKGLKRRLRAWRLSHQVEASELRVAISNRGMKLTSDLSVAEVCASVAEFQHHHGAPALVVIDTLARNFGPGDENSTKDMSAAVAACDEIRERTGATVLLVHHSGHTDTSRARGSIAMLGALQAEIRMTVDEDRLIRFENTKQKDADPAPAKAFRLHTVDLGYTDAEGAPVTSAVLRPADYVPPKAGQRAGGGKHQQRALDILQELRQQHEARLTASGNDPRTARVGVDDWRGAMAAAQMSRQRISDAVRSLEAAGRVRIDFGFVSEVQP